MTDSPKTEPSAPEQSAPTTLAQLSDLHLRPGEDGRGPAERLELAVRHIAGLQPRPHAVLLSGDLADAPSSAAYEQAHELLSPLGVPLYAIPGNHDDRDLLRARFGPSPQTSDSVPGMGHAVPSGSPSPKPRPNGLVISPCASIR